MSTIETTNFSSAYKTLHEADARPVRRKIKADRRERECRRCRVIGVIIGIVVAALIGGAIGILYAVGIFDPSLAAGPDQSCSSVWNKSDRGGSIVYPPNNAPYPSNALCEWNIIAPKETSRIEIVINYISILENARGCVDSLKVLSTNGTVLREFCSVGIAYPYIVYYNMTSLTLHFTSNTTGQMDGFRLAYYFYTIPGTVPSPTLCGKSPNLAHRIVGGNVSTPGQWPWQVFIVVSRNKGASVCGGSVINDRWIVTVATCVAPKSSDLDSQVKDIVVRVGAFNLWERRPEERWIPYQSLFVHPDYNSTTKENNVVLIRLSEQAVVTPICLITPDSIQPQPGAMCTTVGWGETDDPRQDPAAALRQLNIPILSAEICNTFSSTNLTSYEMCAGNIEGASACGVDYGGPLMFQRSTDQAYVAVGVNSYGLCDRPTVFSKIGSFYDWINKTIS